MMDMNENFSEKAGQEIDLVYGLAAVVNSRTECFIETKQMGDGYNNASQ